jgi:ribosomal protein S12 methylthiotransferase
VQKYAEELKQALPEVDVFIGTGDVPEIPRILDSLEENNKILHVTSPENYLYDDSLSRDTNFCGHYAYVKIAEGCNNRCTYCVIPSIRGPYRSRTIESINKEARELVEHGVKEIILVAQDTTYYGYDLKRQYLLPDLLRELVKIPGLHWIRLLYCYPDHITDELLNTIKSEDKICNYLDIPLQHVSDNVLRAMGRPMDKDRIKKLLARIKDTIPEITLRSTFIVGFPGETKKEFNELLEFLNEERLERAGFFTYSKEPDTRASLYKGQISEKEKTRRAETASMLQEKILADKQSQYVNKVLELIVDGISEDYQGLWEGRTRGDSPEVDGVVYFNPSSNIKSGDIIKIRITHSNGFALMGEIYNESSK